MPKKGSGTKVQGLGWAVDRNRWGRTDSHGNATTKASGSATFQASLLQQYWVLVKGLL